MLLIRCDSGVKSWRNKKRSTRITRIKPFINKYNWKVINFPSEKDNWKKFEKNNRTIALNVLYAKKYIYILPMFCLKNITQIVKKKFLSMIPNGEGWHYLAVKKLSALLRKTTSNQHDDFYCLDCFLSFATENKGESRKKVCKNKDLCNIIIPSEDK